MGKYLLSLLCAMTVACGDDFSQKRANPDEGRNHGDCSCNCAGCDGGTCTDCACGCDCGDGRNDGGSNDNGGTGGGCDGACPPPSGETE